MGNWVGGFEVGLANLSCRQSTTASKPFAGRLVDTQATESRTLSGGSESDQRSPETSSVF